MEMPLVAEGSLVRNLYYQEEVEKAVEVDEEVVLPVERGQVMGKVTYIIAGDAIGEVPLIAEHSVGRATLGVKVKYFWALFANWVGGVV
jgi:D-alanyl-D-alanine carboxypeptidase